jgi:hypothetical protein
MYELEKGWDLAMEGETMDETPFDAMEHFGKWLARREATADFLEDDRHAVELVDEWVNELEGERETLVLPGLDEGTR